MNDIVLELATWYRYPDLKKYLAEGILIKIRN